MAWLSTVALILHTKMVKKKLVKTCGELINIFWMVKANCSITCSAFQFCIHENDILLPKLFWPTLQLNEGIPRTLKGKKLCLKIPRVLPFIFELLLVFQIWEQSTIGGQYLQNINALIFWHKYLQKGNAMLSDFWWKKNTSFSPLTNIF